MPFKERANTRLLARVVPVSGFLIVRAASSLNSMWGKGLRQTLISGFDLRCHSQNPVHVAGKHHAICHPSLDSP
jgi:hypothetical protein